MLDTRAKVVERLKSHCRECESLQLWDPDLMLVRLSELAGSLSATLALVHMLAQKQDR